MKNTTEQQAIKLKEQLERMEAYANNRYKDCKVLPTEGYQSEYRKILKEYNRLRQSCKKQLPNFNLPIYKRCKQQ